MAVMALEVHSLPVLVVGVVVAGLLLGVMNTVLTESVMEATDLPRNVASSTYSGVRFLGGAIAAAVAGPLAAAVGPATPYWTGVAAFGVSAGLIMIGHRRLTEIDDQPVEEPVEEAAAVTAGDA